MAVIALHDGSLAQVSDEDLEAVLAHKWYLKDGYPSTRLTRSKHTTLHSFLMGPAPAGMVVDHVNRDRLDNRRENLRFVTRSQNCLNFTKRKAQATSKHRGVCWDKGKEKWRAQLMVDGKRVFCGMFDDEDEAGRAVELKRAEYLPS